MQDEEEIVVDEELHHGVQVEEVVNASMNDESNSNDALLEDEDENEGGNKLYQNFFILWYL